MNASIFEKRSSRFRNYFSACLFLSLVLSGCSSERQPVSAAPETISDVSVVVAKTENIPDVVQVVGTVRAAETSQLAAQITGNIVEMRVHEGDNVRRGQVMAAIDATQAQAGLDQATAADLAAQKAVAAAEADLALAESTLKRYEILFARKSLSPQEFDEIKARCQGARARDEMARAQQAQAKAALQHAQAVLGYTHVVAPFDGIVTERKAEVGTLASPGTPILTLENQKRYRLEVSVNETDLRFVHTGEPVAAAIDAAKDREFTGKINEIVPAADAGSRTFLVKVDLPSHPLLRSGLFGRALFKRGERAALLIPRTAVMDRGQMSGVFVVDQKRVAILRYVTLGTQAADQVEILTGLESGESVIANPSGRELSGRKIEAR